MALRKLAILFLLTGHALAAAIPTSPPIQPNTFREISFPSIKDSPTNQAASWASSERDPPADKRSPYYFPETIQDDEDLENEVSLREIAMREAGFIPSSSRSSGEVQKSSRHPVPGSNAGIGAASVGAGDRARFAGYMGSSSKPSEQGGFLEELTTAAYEASEDERTLCPPFGFFVVAAVVVCFVTILRGIGAKK
ncbi:hypothetical protein N7499_001769 [Penicillium canescens]|uniref:Uncharacterized protein n=1 Tax=Penicillium canescens TaxID=5083 RepID=A0AAD6I615_PENCN|nr:uncharacterized protein N7446_009315 [Penicillium canescens]KAJ5981218.1 hypothetical protein N7522_013639 [Penicillium canescens]KAJ6034565.1 hypothetical protein N7460_008740 [Penicillium canescens]KAJ6046224.1 hypothetical protein N7444_007478 [Penicillium canescens]KAJ6053303.1 hypothetical protein N7446_009315 [Penicillium canescens]KAJ6097395.1 hypothetical protein N7499_001769 [Penicillium canescens]